jgi:virginiamycin A acetyltransferase
MRLKLFGKRRGSRFDPTTKVQHSSRVSDDTIIGRYCYVGERCDITRAEIGHYVSIANNVSIGPGEHQLTAISTNSLFYTNTYDDLTRAPLVIRADAWIGVDAIIRRGVTIGYGAAVGANSFVNADVPDFGIVAGSPARLVGFRFTEAMREKILASRWWELDRDQAASAIEDLSLAEKRPQVE